MSHVQPGVPGAAHAGLPCAAMQGVPTLQPEPTRCCAGRYQDNKAQYRRLKPKLDALDASLKAAVERKGALAWGRCWCMHP